MRGARAVFLGLGAALLLALLLAAAFGWSRRLALAEDWLRGQIEAYGVEPVALEVTRLDLDGIDVGSLAIGVPEPATVDSVRVAWSFESLRHGLFDRVEIAGVRLRAAVDEEGSLDLGPLAPLLESDDGEGGAITLPAPRIDVADLRLDLETPRGPAFLVGEVRVEERGAGEVEGEVALRLEHPQLGAEADLVLEGPLDALEGELRVRPRVALPEIELAELGEIRGRFALGEPGPRVQLELPEIEAAMSSELGRVSARTPALAIALETDEEAGFVAQVSGRGGWLLGPDLRAEGLRAELELRGLHLTGSLGIASLRDLQKPPRFAPISLGVELDGPPQALDFRLHATDSERSLELRVRGRADATRLDARADVALEPLQLDPGTLARLAPAVAAQAGEVTGEIAAHGEVRISAGALSSASAELALRNVGVASGTTGLEALNGTISLQGPDPWTTPGEQLLSIGLLDAGLPLSNGLVRWRLLPGLEIDVPSAEFRVAGGELRGGASIELGEGGFDVVLVAISLDLAQLLEGIDFEGLDGTGHISGAIPIAVRSGSVRVNDARLLGDPPGGTLVYAPDASAQALARQQAQSLGVAVQALSDLRWELLELALDGDTADSMQVRVSLGGTNPEFHDGRRVQFNLNLEARLADLVQRGIEAYRVPQVIEDRLSTFARERGSPSPEEE